MVTGDVSRSVIRSDGVMPPGVLLSGKARKKKMVFENSRRVGVDERWFGSEFQICGATDENDREVAMEVLRKGTHIDKDEEDRSDRTGALPWNEYSEVGGLLKL